MGSCVSATKHPDSVMDAKMSFGSNLDIPSPIKDNKPFTNGDRPIGEIGLKSYPYPATDFRDFGSKEDTFFDSRAWLDSDCDDDFMSVNGEFTPSRGNTPVHHFATSTPQVNTAHFEDPAPGAKPEPSPTKMRLSDLFKQSLRDQDSDEQYTSENLIETTPYASGVQSSERTPNGNIKPLREKSVKSMPCCLPSLLSTRSFSERKKKMSPVPSIG